MPFKLHVIETHNLDDLFINNSLNFHNFYIFIQQQFPVNCNESFLKQVQNNHLELKLWEKTEFSEKLVGATKIPLHQFFIAFRDAAMIDHLSGNQLPIISFDNWTNFVTPLSNELFCQGKVLLAIGSENQIDYLKLLRNLEKPRPRPRQEVVKSNSEQRNQMTNKLSAFIESLSQKLPETGVQSTNSNLHKLIPLPAAIPQMKKTSELLDTLQKALSQPPVLPLPSLLTSPPPHQHQQELDRTSSASNYSFSQEKVQMIVCIDQAVHLPKVVKKKQNRKKNKLSGTPQKVEFEPSVYATFECCLEHIDESFLPGTIVKSHEGLVHCTNVVKGCDVAWNQTFDVHIYLDVFTNPQKKFIVKVWRKVSQESEMKPSPFSDAVVGFSAIDLSVLMTGLPVLSGYYNIVDFAGKVNGQLKLSLTPQVDLLRYQNSTPDTNSTITSPLNICVAEDNGQNLLSRTLKRKFTELDEITQRLKARLHDVTGDENFDPDDEFERDLNTCVDDVEEGKFESPDYAWLSNDSNDNGLGNQLLQMLETLPSTSKSATSSFPETQRKVTGCSDSQTIDQLLKKYDLDTIINPNIFQNLLDPSLANSDSTPTLISRPDNTTEAACVSGESGDTTVSSILSNDQMRTIQSALQKTTLGDSEPSSSRKDPDGENNFSE